MLLNSFSQKNIDSSKPLLFFLPAFGHMLFPEPIIMALALDFAHQFIPGNEAEDAVNYHG